MTAIVKINVADQEYNAQLLATLKSKSSVIRYLAAEGWDRSRIAKSFPGEGIRYQHVRNVLIKGLKKNVVREATPEDLGL